MFDIWIELKHIILIYKLITTNHTQNIFIKRDAIILAKLVKKKIKIIFNRFSKTIYSISPIIVDY